MLSNLLDARSSFQEKSQKNIAVNFFKDARSSKIWNHVLQSWCQRYYWVRILGVNFQGWGQGADPQKAPQGQMLPGHMLLLHPPMWHLVTCSTMMCLRLYLAIVWVPLKVASRAQPNQPGFWQLANVWLKTKILGAVSSQCAPSASLLPCMLNLCPMGGGSAMVLQAWAPCFAHLVAHPPGCMCPRGGWQNGPGIHQTIWAHPLGPNPATQHLLLGIHYPW